jgi:hypothetical protein
VLIGNTKVTIMILLATCQDAVIRQISEANTTFISSVMTDKITSKMLEAARWLIKGLV